MSRDTTVSTLDLVPEGAITGRRRDGNTTRLVDAAVQALFQGRKVRMLDHHNTVKSSKELADRVIHRLHEEHGISERDIIMDENGLVFRLDFKHHVQFTLRDIPSIPKHELPNTYKPFDNTEGLFEE